MVSESSVFGISCSGLLTVSFSVPQTKYAMLRALKVENAHKTFSHLTLQMGAPFPTRHGGCVSQLCPKSLITTTNDRHPPFLKSS